MKKITEFVKDIFSIALLSLFLMASFPLLLLGLFTNDDDNEDNYYQRYL